MLVADDSAVNREVADAALTRLGVRAHFVEDGQAAVAAAAASPYDLILMDGSMPGMDGFAATRAIRAEEHAQQKPRAPIIALTAHVVGTAAQAWREAGMDDVIHKPFTLQQLQQCLQKFIGKAESAVSQHFEMEIGAPSAPVLIDTRVLHDLLAMADGSKDTVARITQLFIENAARTLAQLKQAVAQGDHDATGRNAHALKSMSANIGAQHIAYMASQIESMARQDKALPDQEGLFQIQHILDRTCAALVQAPQAA
ncbi:MAG: response regulator [Beijerinckiaceae bacterium]